MNPREFYELAKELSQRTRPSEIRSSISRAYYAVYHVSVEILEKLGFQIPKGPGGHGDVQRKLANSGDQEVTKVGDDLNNLQSMRIKADYRLEHKAVENPKTAQAWMRQVERMIQVLAACLSEPKRSQLTKAIQEYEKKISS